MMHQLDEAILKARFDDNVHVIVLRGHGDKFFSAGANIGNAQQGDAAVQVLLLSPRERTLTGWSRRPSSRSRP